MTAADKSNIIQLINYYEAKADNARRCEKNQPIQFVSGWFGGLSYARREMADDLRKLLDAGEVEV